MVDTVLSPKYVYYRTTNSPIEDIAAEEQSNNDEFININKIQT